MFVKDLIEVDYYILIIFLVNKLEFKPTSIEQNFISKYKQIIFEK